MRFAVRMTNVKADELAATLRFLEINECTEVEVTKDPTRANEFSFGMYCDTDEDIAACLAVMLFYNDRQPETIAAITTAMAELLEGFPRTSALDS